MLDSSASVRKEDVMVQACRCMITALLLGLLSPVSAAGQAPGFPAWFGLFTRSSVDRLSNEYRLDALCPAPADGEACRRKAMSPSLDVFVLHHAPDTASPRIGEIVVVATPGRPLAGYFRDTLGNSAEWFEPDVYLADWGYGPPYFHHTISALEDGWVQVAPGPWDGPAWVELSGDVRADNILTVMQGDIVELDGEVGMFVTRASPDALWMRPEQAADMWCEEGDPPPLSSDAPRQFRRGELLDSAGRLRIRPKYMKGC